MDRIQVLLVTILLAVMVIVTEPSPIDMQVGHRGLLSDSGFCLPDDEECASRQLQDAEISMVGAARELRPKNRYISYWAMRQGAVPCSRKGSSYYYRYCTKSNKVNPYRRGCSYVTHCARDTN